MSQQEESPVVNCRVEKKRPAWRIVAGLALLALLVGVAAISCGGAAGQQNSKKTSGDEPQAAADLEHPSLGDESAPVVMTEYADYQ